MRRSSNYFDNYFFLNFACVFEKVIKLIEMISMNMYFVFLLNYCVLIVYSLNDETKLWKDIIGITGYNKNVRQPTLNKSDPIEVKIEIVLYTIHALNMKDQILTTSLGITMSWTDEFLKWNESLHKEINKMSASLSEIWNPDVVLTNSADNLNIFEDREKLVNIYSNGLVEWHDHIEVKTYCFVDATRYPFETETCSFNFSAQYLDNKEQLLSIPLQDDFLKYFQSNGEWQITKPDRIRNCTTVHDINGKNVSGVVLQIEMVRRQTYYVWKFFIPTVAITFMNLITFCLPVKSDQKVTLSTFAVLSLTVMIQLFNQSLPNSSDKISHFGRLLWFLLCISGISLIVNVILTAYFHRKCKALCSICNCCNKKENTDKQQNQSQEETTFKRNNCAKCCCKRGNDNQTLIPLSLKSIEQGPCQENKSMFTLSVPL